MNTRRLFSAASLALTGPLCITLATGAASQAPQTPPAKAGSHGKPGPKPPPAAAAAPVWRPDPRLVAGLAPAVTVAGYSVQPPPGCVPSVESNGPMTGYGWKGPAHPDGISPAFYLTVLVVPPGDPSEMTLTHALASEQKSQQKYEPDVTFSPPGFGSVNGLSFVRAYWKGHDTQGVMRHGLFYATVDGRTACLIGGQDSEPYSAASLPLMEAATLTFRKSAGP